LPVEPSTSSDPSEPSAAAATWPTHLVDAWSIGDIVVTAVAATWHKAVFRIRRRDEVRWVTVPGLEVDAFVGGLIAGEFDDWLDRLLSAGRRALPFRQQR
jgi:hypothetical protein